MCSTSTSWFIIQCRFHWCSCRFTTTYARVVIVNPYKDEWNRSSAYFWLSLIVGTKILFSRTESHYISYYISAIMVIQTVYCSSNILDNYSNYVSMKCSVSADIHHIIFSYSSIWRAINIAVYLSQNVH